MLKIKKEPCHARVFWLFEMRDDVIKEMRCAIEDTRVVHLQLARIGGWRGGETHVM